MTTEKLTWSDIHNRVREGTPPTKSKGPFGGHKCPECGKSVYGDERYIGGTHQLLGFMACKHCGWMHCYTRQARQLYAEYTLPTYTPSERVKIPSFWTM